MTRDSINEVLLARYSPNNRVFMQSIHNLFTLEQLIKLYWLTRKQVWRG
jgi:hypothetical protein